MHRIAAIITTLDNQPNNVEQLHVLKAEPLIDKIIFVNNGSVDNTRQWLDAQEGITVIHRQNNGAGPGRNAGLDAAGDCDYFLMLDGGIRPLYDGTKQMLDYLEREQVADVIGVEIADFETDYSKAHRRWAQPITTAYHNRRLSHTAYCLARSVVFKAARFSEAGPFGEPGWGADDDEMAYSWNNCGIVVHVTTCHCRHGKDCTSVHPYRRASGSFRRLYRETGIWPNQYGSVYEKRLVWLQQVWCKYQPGTQWGEPHLTVIIQAGGIENTATMIKSAHDQLRKRTFAPPYQNSFAPYQVEVVGGNAGFLAWAEPRRLRQHHGDTIIVNGERVRRNADNEATWTGDFMIGRYQNPPHYFGIVESQEQLDNLIARYNQVWPRQKVNTPPEVTRCQIS